MAEMLVREAERARARLGAREIGGGGAGAGVMLRCSMVGPLPPDDIVWNEPVRNGPGDIALLD